MNIKLDIPKQPISEEMVKDFANAIKQYSEGAVLASEVLMHCINVYLEKENQVFEEHELLMKLYKSN